MESLLSISSISLPVKTAFCASAEPISFFRSWHLTLMTSIVSFEISYCSCFLRSNCSSVSSSKRYCPASKILKDRHKLVAQQTTAYSLMMNSTPLLTSATGVLMLRTTAVTRIRMVGSSSFFLFRLMRQPRRSAQKTINAAA